MTNRPVKLYDLAGSPNNTKVRLGLAYKKIPYEKIAVDFQDREALIKVSGQPLAPVLVHGDTVLFDSSAILRYLEANFPGTPRLFSSERQIMQQIEEWELFARTQAGEGVRIVFRQSQADAPDADAIRKANESIQRAASRTEEILGRTPYLTGSAPTAADLSVAPLLNLGLLAPAVASIGPIQAFFQRNLRIEGMPKTREWVSRVMALES
jgi:glutathione S-transferase